MRGCWPPAGWWWSVLLWQRGDGASAPGCLKVWPDIARQREAERYPASRSAAGCC